MSEFKTWPSISAFPRESKMPEQRNCRGLNHSDWGKVGKCDDCWFAVVKDTRGRLHPYNDSGYACYGALHECDPEQVKRVAEAKAEKTANGEVIKGATVEVFKGRKVPIGTVGEVGWIGDNGWGTSVGLKVEGEEKFVFTAVTNVRVKEE